MDPVICCLLGICCPPFSDEQRDKLATLLVGRHGLTVIESRKMATNLIDGMRPFIAMLQPIIAEARKHDA